MIAMKKLFPNFNAQFIDHALVEVLEILKENAHLLELSD
jgi:hypothetical protein